MAAPREIASILLAILAWLVLPPAALFEGNDAARMILALALLGGVYYYTNQLTFKRLFSERVSSVTQLRFALLLIVMLASAGVTLNAYVHAITVPQLAVDYVKIGAAGVAAIAVVQSAMHQK